MMVISYTQGQKHYPIPYAKKKLITYLTICAIFYIIHQYLIAGNIPPKASYYHLVYYGTSFLFLGLFTLLIFKVEKKEIQKLPFIGKFIR
jgi:hypothetical protein